MRAAPWAVSRRRISTSASRETASENSTPRWASTSRRSSVASSGKASMPRRIALPENCSTMQRSSTVVPGATSLTQLCGTFGPIRHSCPGSKWPVWSPTKYCPEVRVIRLISYSGWKCQRTVS